MRFMRMRQNPRIDMPAQQLQTLPYKIGVFLTASVYHDQMPLLILDRIKHQRFSVGAAILRDHPLPVIIRFFDVSAVHMIRSAGSDKLITVCLRSLHGYLFFLRISQVVAVLGSRKPCKGFPVLLITAHDPKDLRRPFRFDPMPPNRIHAVRHQNIRVILTDKCHKIICRNQFFMGNSVGSSIRFYYIADIDRFLRQFVIILLSFKDR